MAGSEERERREGSAERMRRSPQGCAAAWWMETRAEGDSGRAKSVCPHDSLMSPAPNGLHRILEVKKERTDLVAPK